MSVTSETVRLPPLSREQPSQREPLGAQSDRTLVLVIIASLLATIPIWLTSFPPMVDLPEHAAQVGLLRSLHNPSFGFSELFWVNWFTPYLFGYILVYALTPLFGIVAASKLVVAAAVAAVPIATAMLADETGADPYWALLTIPAMYGYSYSWGFLNFLVATPVGLLFLLLFIRRVRKPTLRNGVCLGLFSIVLFFCHALTYLFLATIAVLYALLETGRLRKAIIVAIPVITAIPIAFLWYLRTSADPSAQDPIVWGLNWFSTSDPHTWGGRLTGFFPRLLGLWSPLFCLIFGIALFALPFLAGARPSKRWAVWVPLSVCVAVMLFGPTGGHSGWALSQRFAIFALPFFVLGMERSSTSRPAWRAAPVFILLAWICVLISVTENYEIEAKGFTQILSAMQPNQRALSLMFLQNTKASPAPVFLHLPAWYSATKQGVVDMSFAVFPVALVRYRPTLPSQDRSVSEWRPETFEWETWHGDLYRYFVVHATVDLGPRLFGRAPCPVSLVTRSDNWWLYEKDPQCTSGEEQTSPPATKSALPR
jgi:hypothetical protein